MGKTAEELIDIYTAAFKKGDLAALKDCFHKDAAIIGAQDGLFVTADRLVYTGFLARMGIGKSMSGRPVVSQIWENQQGKIAVSCLVEEVAGASTVAYVTMLQTAEGWKLISKSFVAQEAVALHPAGSVRPQ